MVFSSMVFMCVFLPVILALYYVLPALKAKNIVLIIGSLLFYAYGEPVYVLLMIFSILMNYAFGRGLEIAGYRLRKVVLAIAVMVNLGFLAVFKYADMIVQTINELCQTSIPELKLALPVGISFFTFQAMSYVIDVYRKEVKVQKNMWNTMLYISFFPQLIAGPIVKYHDIEAQITNRHTDVREISEGMRRFIIGLAKKVLISNTVAAAADALFAVPAGEMNIVSAWIAALSYMLQIYYDFSGYSDMAIGLGHMFGFRFLENFRHPYIAENIQDFWRRWHISLSTWFREYLYFPLGGNRKGKARTCINKGIVFFSTGLWHGADWTFVIWGLWHGFFILIEEILPIKKMPRILCHIYTLLVVCIGFVMFRADSFGQGIQVIGKMFTGWNFSADAMRIALGQLSPLFLLIFLLALIGCMPVLEWIKQKVADNGRKQHIAATAGYVGSLVLLVLCMLSLSGGTYNPFIYFRF